MNNFFKKISVFLAFLFLAAFIVFANFYGLLEKPKNFINFFVANSAASFWSVSGKIGKAFSFFTGMGNVYYEISDLKNKNSALMEENVRLKNLFEEKKFSADAANLGKSSKWDLQTAKIMGIDTQNFLGFLLIDGGSQDDIDSGLAVITKDKFLIGKIADVNKNFSKVMTIFHPDSKVAVRTQDSHVFGVLSGDYLGNLKMDMIDKAKVISEKELVITSGRDGIFPEGLIMGEVQSFQSKPENLFQTATVKRFLDIYDLDDVLIIKDF